MRISLRESILRFLFNYFNNLCLKLLEKMNQPSLKTRRIIDMLTLVYLALNDAAPSYISQLFTERSPSISLRGRRKLVIPSVDTTKYGLHLFRYYASKQEGGGVSRQISGLVIITSETLW